MSQFVDFAELKARVSIEQVVAWLGIELKRSGEQLRGKCPVHDGSDPRQFVVTPAKGVWYCFGDCKEGGDAIELVAKVKGCSTREAALLMQEAFLRSAPPEQRKLPPQGLDYLNPDHALVLALGFAPEAARALGVGYANKGLMRGRVAIPLRMPDGALAGYVGINPELDPVVKLPNTLFV